MAPQTLTPPTETPPLPTEQLMSMTGIRTSHPEDVIVTEAHSRMKEGGEAVLSLCAVGDESET